MSKIFERAENLKHFLGGRVLGLFLVSLLAGVAWFAVESSFVFVLQGFLLSLGLLQKTQTMLPEWYPSEVADSILILICFGFLRSLLFAMKLFVSESTNQAFIRHQRSLIIDYALHNAHLEPSHRIMSLFNERMAQAGSVLQQSSLILNTGVAFLLFFVMGLQLSPRELLIGVGLLAILMWPFKFLDQWTRKVGQNVVQDGDDVMKLLVVGMKNYFYLKLFALVGVEVEKGHRLLASLERRSRAFLKFSAFRSSYPQFVGILTIGFLTWVGMMYFQTPGVVLLSLFYIFLRLAQNAAEMNSSLGTIRYSLAGFLDLFRWNQKASKELAQLKQLENVEQVELADRKVHITAKNLKFSYDAGRPVINDINFSVGPSQMLLIQGPSGSGKSTLVSLVLGLLAPQEGSVLINSLPVQKVRKSFLQRLAYVGPEPYLVSGGVRENLLYGHPRPEGVSDEQMWEALKKAELEAVVRGMPLGLNEVLLESAQLSTGQKQRLAVARALVRKSSVLILDEATANLDSETEAKLLKTFKDLGQEMTMIVISHRSSFDHLATQKVVLSERGFVAHG